MHSCMVLSQFGVYTTQTNHDLSCPMDYILQDIPGGTHLPISIQVEITSFIITCR